MSSIKNYKRGDLVTMWRSRHVAGKFDNTKVIALIVHYRGDEYITDILHEGGVTSVWRVNLKDLQDNEAISALYQNAKVKDR